MVEIKGEFGPVLEQIEKDKGIKKEEILKMIESALVSAYKKHSGKNLNIEASINPETGEIKAFIIKKVVEVVQNSNFEISLEDAKKLNSKAKIDAQIKTNVQTADFSRIAAQTAKQVIIQKIRETEKENIYTEFKQKEGQLMNGSVHRFIEKNIIVDLGKVEAILPFREQVRTEKFNIGERLKVVIIKVEKGNKGPQIILSRTSPILVRRLFEVEVPEVYEKTVEILNIVREPGMRSKVAVRSNNPKVDPVGACVGVKGSRVKPIIDELYGERIDLIPYRDDIYEYIKVSLSPAKIQGLSLINDKNKEVEITVADEMLSLAIGKAGQNVRLAARLTGWHIDIKSESQRRDKVKEKIQEEIQVLSNLKGVGSKTVEVLIKSGWTSPERLAEAKAEDLTALQGVGEKTAQKIIDSAEEYINKFNKTSDDDAENKDKANPVKKSKAKSKRKNKGVDIGKEEDKTLEKTEKTAEHETEQKIEVKADAEVEEEELEKKPENNTEDKAKENDKDETLDKTEKASEDKV
ncbi:MAG: transcription termination factor NusA [bacterium]